MTSSWWLHAGNVGGRRMNECECIYENDVQVYECEWCYYEYEDKCTCKEDHIDLNCQECYWWSDVLRRVQFLFTSQYQYAYWKTWMIPWRLINLAQGS